MATSHQPWEERKRAKSVGLSVILMITLSAITPSARKTNWVMPMVVYTAGQGMVGRLRNPGVSKTAPVVARRTTFPR